MPPSSRLRRDQRAADPPFMRLMPRDLAVLKAVAEYRVLRQDQLQALFFGSKSTAQYRLAHLYQHGFLARHFLPVCAGWSPTLYVLDRRGVDMLQAEYGADVEVTPWDRDRSALFVEHALAINDVRVAMTLACRSLGYVIPTWRGETQMKAAYDRVTVQGHAVSLIPDSYFVLQTATYQAHFFLEVDRGTMTTKRFADKIMAYQAYVVSGQYQQHYKTRSLRVLTVTTSSARLIHLKAATEQVQGGRMFWFGVLEEMNVQVVLQSPIWHVAGQEGQYRLIE